MNNRGSSSVFLLLLFVVLLGGIGILLECARNEGMKSYSESIVSSAADTLMTEYYRPLWDEYHVLFMAYENGQDKEAFIRSYIEKQMQFSLEPRMDMTRLKKYKYGHSIISPKVENIEIKNIQTAIDDDGMVYEKEAVSYMKYRALEKSYKMLKEVFGKVDTLKPANRILQKKMECEQQLQQITNKNLELMRIIDGVRLDEKDNYKVHIESSFAKLLVSGEVTMNNVGVNNEYMWTKLKNKYVNVYAILSSVESNVDHALVLQEQIDELQKELAQGKDNAEKEGDKKGEEIQSLIEESSRDYYDMLTQIKHDCNQFVYYLNCTERSLSDACKLVKDMQREQQSMIVYQQEYKAELESGRNDISQELYQGLVDDYADMGEITVGGLDCKTVSNILEENLVILKQVHEYDMIRVNGNSLYKIRSMASTYKGLLKNYSLSNITFQYGGSSNSKYAKNPVTNLKEMVGSGIMELVLPDDLEVSNKQLMVEVMMEQDTVSEDNVQIGKTNRGLDLIDTFKQAATLFKGNQSIELEDIKGIPDVFLMYFYQEEHFRNVLDLKDKKNHCLDYEEEYLLGGHLKDKENLQSIIDKIIIWRTITNFISIMTDKEKQKVAHEMALIIAGITGIEPLIHVTQTLILLAWSMEEAMVDTAALLQGREVELIKAGCNFAVTYEQLLLMNHQKIQELSSKIIKSGSDTMSYEQFVSILLLLGASTSTRLRTMDLVNGNLMNWYDKGFNLRQCVHGYDVHVNVMLHKKYLQKIEFGKYSIRLHKSY